MKSMRLQHLLASLAPLSLLLMSGCFSTISTMTPGKDEWIQTHSTQPLVGNVYLTRGLIGLFSGGIDVLTEEINKDGIEAHVWQEDQHEKTAATIAAIYAKYRNDHEPIILIGHSLGADDSIITARALDQVNVPVDMLITIDATRPPLVPKNVKVCYNYYQPSIFDGTGILRGIPLQTEPGFTGKLYNMNVRAEYKNLLEWDTNHVNIDKNEKIHADIIAKLKTVCIPRGEWVAMHGHAGMASSTTQPSSMAKLPAAPSGNSQVAAH